MKQLAESIISIAIKAGEIIRHYYCLKEYDFTKKVDDSPLTVADQMTNKFLISELKKITPDLPILSEESDHPAFQERKFWQQYWLIDPLDGTKSFLKGGNEFVVSIALISKGAAKLGIIYEPVSDNCYYAFNGGGAYQRINASKNNDDIKINCSNKKEELIIIVGRAKPISKKLEHKLEKVMPYRLIYCASAIKFCQVAKGDADLYLRLYPTYEWDTAAGQCILDESYGETMDLETKISLSYNKESLINPYFIAGPLWAIQRIKKALHT
ncbi:3'(2'),5'-bisphosphate nucleotidase CysQ [Thiotrichales bacterium 19S9-12]|nr:3'(2'),5'-bisphosphate nucleotidase CysQ [Thiotrichales bacterium 19S9-11]MCF6811854.1 3'(2'),5'-bisphosphate nucleotidase CysQ [Thiotrichales bacterium 19S9-12]